MTGIVDNEMLKKIILLIGLSALIFDQGCQYIKKCNNSMSHKKHVYQVEAQPGPKAGSAGKSGSRGPENGVSR